jgi:hypothetical protein
MLERTMVFSKNNHTADDLDDSREHADQIRGEERMHSGSNSTDFFLEIQIRSVIVAFQKKLY